MDFRATQDLLAAAESAELSDAPDTPVHALARVRFAAARGGATTSAYTPPNSYCGHDPAQDASCVVWALAVTRSTLDVDVVVSAHDPANPDHDPCASKILVLGARGSAVGPDPPRHAFGARCGIRGESRVSPTRESPRGALACTLVFSRPGGLVGGEEVLFEFGGNGFSVVSLGRLPALPE